MQALAEVAPLSVDQRLAARYEKFRRMGSEGTAFIDTEKADEKPGSHEIPHLAAPAMR